MTEQPLIADLRLGDQLRGVFRLKQLVPRRTPQDKPFLLGELQDRSGVLGFVCWQLGRMDQESLRSAGYGRVRGTVERHRDRLQLVVQQLEPVDPASVDPASFQPAGTVDAAACWQELVELIGAVDDPWIRRLLEAIFIEDEAFGARFREAPAGVTMHHGYRHGLLAHSLAVARLALDCAARYEAIDRDLLLAGALLHDCCKVDELDWEGVPRYTTAGNLVGHVAMGTVLLARTAAAIPDFPERLLWKLQHLLLSHHGEPAHGALKEPMLLEAVVLHLVDNLDSRIAGFIENLEQTSSADPEWTEPSRMFGRRLYRGDPD